jgi:dihydropteroate synthase
LKKTSASNHTPWGKTITSINPLPWKIGEQLMGGKRPLIMGILNITPDSFFDGGRYNSIDRAIAHCSDMIQGGADIIDVGGESTRPGSQSVKAPEDINRVIPIITELVKRFDKPVSIDTTKSEVAVAALQEGALIINDISGMTSDPGMIQLAVKNHASVVINHIKGKPQNMQDNPEYDNVVLEVRNFLKEQIQRLNYLGLPKEKIAVDPGIGFGKQLVHNYRLIARMEEMAELECPVLLGLSRKSFIGKTPGLETSDRLHPSLGAAVLAAFKGASVLRVHDVRETWEQLRVIEAVLSGGSD